MCGASSAQKQVQQDQLNFYNQLTQNYGTVFGENQQLLGALTSSFEPILSAGVNQQGFSPQELQNMESQAVTGTGQNFAKAENALATAQANQGGGRTFVPSGAQAQQKAQLATNAASAESGLESNIISQNYAVGRENYLAAAGILGQLQNQTNPNSYAGSANTAGSNAATTANQIAQQNNSWMQLVSGALGGLAGAAGNKLGGGSKNGGQNGGQSTPTGMGSGGSSTPTSMPGSSDNGGGGGGTGGASGGPGGGSVPYAPVDNPSLLSSNSFNR